jgi:carbamoyltransferase
LHNPMNIMHKDLLNEYKRREWWRPVAPIVLEDDLEDWFIEPFKSPYMLNNFQVREEVASQIPAMLHMDGSARVQSVNYYDDPEIFTVITKFKALTGVPIICNTSFK